MPKKKSKWSDYEDTMITDLYLKAPPSKRVSLRELKAEFHWMGYNRTQDAIRSRAHILRRELQREGTQSRQAAWFEGARFGFYDIETTNFQANFGHMLSWAVFLPDGTARMDERGRIQVPLTGKVKWDAITRKQAIDYSKFDKAIVQSCVDMIYKDVDILVGYYSDRFDNPFVRTRADYWGIDFPLYQEKYTYDVWRTVRMIYKLGRNTLDQATELLGIEGKTHVKPGIWAKAKVGDPEAMEYVVDHNKEDVKILAELFNKVSGYRPLHRKSL